MSVSRQIAHRTSELGVFAVAPPGVSDDVLGAGGVLKKYQQLSKWSKRTFGNLTFSTIVHIQLCKVLMCSSGISTLIKCHSRLLQP